MFTSRYISVWSMVLKLEWNFRGLVKVKSSQCFFPVKKICLPVKNSGFPPLKTKYNQWKNLCNYPWKLMSARENDRKIRPVKSSVKIIAKLYAWKTNLWAARPSPPPRPHFWKTPLNVIEFFCRRSPLGQIKIKINLEERSNFIGSTQNPYSKRTQKSQKWKTQRWISSLHMKSKIFQSTFRGWWIVQNANHKNPNLVSVSL